MFGKHSFEKHSILLVATFCCLVCFVGCAGRPAATNAQMFSDAQTAFEDAEKLPVDEQPEAFRHVALIYQSLIDRGVRSGPVYYNQGNAWARADETGRAIAAYHLAQRYMPLNPYIASNLQALGAPERPVPLIEHVLFWQNWFGMKQKAGLASLMLVLTFLSAVTLFFLPHRRVRRLLGILAVLCTISMISTAYDWYRFESREQAVVAVTGAVPRKGNSEQYEQAFSTAPAIGTTTTVKDRRGDWLLLRFASGDEAWLPKEQVVVY